MFHGTAAGFLKAYAANDGSLLCGNTTQTAIVAPPVTYEVDGEQYITVMAGWGGILPDDTGPLSTSSLHWQKKCRILTFKIGGEASLPAYDQISQTVPDLSGLTIDNALAEQGFEVYDRYCGACHGAGAVGSV